MRLILGSEYEAFAQSLKEERTQGLRFNTLKADLEEEMESCVSRFGLEPVPWCREGFYYDPPARPGLHPYHDAGVYYIQEPSAMAAAGLLDVRPGDKVLDLCAAPGGKSTQIAALLEGRGLLVSNEIHPSRAKILSRNIERMGIRNAIVTQEDPETLSRHFAGFFDRILVDAPCSGEGMFRKDEEAIDQWSEENIARCSERDMDILRCAVSMLKAGGKLLYSTCTFETEEDERVIEQLLNENRALSLAAAADMTGSDLFSECTLPVSGTDGAMYRLWPHRLRGEGHFMALLWKTGEAADTAAVKKKKKAAAASLKDRGVLSLVCKEAGAVFNRDMIGTIPEGRFVLQGNELYVIPPDCPSLESLKVLRPGLCLGSVRRDRFELSHALALTVRAGDCREVVSLGADGEKVERYLGGSTFPVSPGIKGWVLVCADEYSLGWGKAADGVLKNHYPKGLRHLV